MEETIKGIQKNGVQACAKHWIGNEQETQRNPSMVNGSIVQESISSNIDDRTIHELYMWPFANAVKAGVSSVMCSYQRLNGSYACENSKSLNGLLKEELGFQGISSIRINPGAISDSFERLHHVRLGCHAFRSRLHPVRP